MWVEIFGPPGVGKTYFRKRLLKAPGFNKELVSNCKAARLDEMLDKRQYLECCEKVRELYAEHSLSGWRLIDGPKFFARRMERAVVAMREEHCVVFDEALLQATVSYSYAVQHDLDLVREFLDVLPPIKVAISCSAPGQLILHRNRMRAREEGGHDRASNALECVSVIAMMTEQLKKKGTVVYEADTQTGTEQLIQEFRQVFNGLP